MKGYESACQPQPDRYQPYDGGQSPPAQALAHMRAMTEKRDGNPVPCNFAEIVDMDSTICIDIGLETEYRTFKTVAAVER